MRWQDRPKRRAAHHPAVPPVESDRWEDRQFREFPEFLHPGDCLVLNDSRVFPARLFGNRPGTSGEVEVFLLQPVSADGRDWDALVRPGRKIAIGERLVFPAPSGEIVLDASTSETSEEELIRIVKSGLGRKAIAAAAAKVGSRLE